MKKERGQSERVRVVKRAGRLELRVDETFASSWRPGQVTTGSVWDALALPVLALPPGRRRRALILGLGGGSAARLLRVLAPGVRIVGVERDADVLRAARRHFGLSGLDVDVVCADARAWLARARRRFDLVVDDVFVGSGDDVHKPEGYPQPSLSEAWRRVAPRGLLVVNALDEAPAIAAALRRLSPHRVRIRIEGYDNHVLLCSRSALDARRLRAAVGREPVLTETLPSLRFRSF